MFKKLKNKLIKMLGGYVNPPIPQQIKKHDYKVVTLHARGYIPMFEIVSEEEAARMKKELANALTDQVLKYATFTTWDEGDSKIPYQATIKVLKEE